jgi:hypothetical protein
MEILTGLSLYLEKKLTLSLRDCRKPEEIVVISD